MNFRTSLFALLCLSGLGTSPVRAQAIDTNRDTTKESISNLKLHGTMSLRELVQFDIKNGLLEAKLVAEVPSSEMVRVEVKGSNATWCVRQQAMGGGSYITLTRYDFDAPADAFWATHLTIRNNYIAVFAQTGDAASGTRVRLTQMNVGERRSLRLYVYEARDGVQNVTFRANGESLRQMQTEFPSELRKHVAPMLKLIAGYWLFKPGGADVYRVFTQIKPDPAVNRRLNDILLKLDADSFTDRETASQELTRLGRPGVLAALRRDAGDLPVEVRNRLDVYIAAHARLDPGELAALRNDPDFLIECLEDEDLAVRQAAKSALETTLGKPVVFDPASSGEARSRAVDAVRQLPELKKPATRPAKP